MSEKLAGFFKGKERDEENKDSIADHDKEAQHNKKATDIKFSRFYLFGKKYVILTVPYMNICIYFHIF